jgi:lysine-N-methylase
VDEEGEACFQLEGDKCPFLQPNGLCQVHIQLGEEATGLICRTHPRFSYDYGPVREVGLCASCPEAARLVLDADPSLQVTAIPEEGEEAPDLLAPLLTARRAATDLLFQGEFPLGERLQALLLFANEVQTLLDNEEQEAIPQLCALYEEEFPLLEGLELPSQREALGKALALWQSLDILSPQWKELLDQGAHLLTAQKPAAPPPHLGERAGAYFLYRHWLRGVWDGDVLTWAELAALGVATAAFLSPLTEEGFPGALRLLCLNLEHSADNLAALQDALWEGKLTLPDLLSIALL